jgi:hypothetical protein
VRRFLTRCRYCGRTLGGRAERGDVEIEDCRCQPPATPSATGRDRPRHVINSPMEPRTKPQVSASSSPDRGRNANPSASRREQRVTNHPNDPVPRRHLRFEDRDSAPRSGPVIGQITRRESQTRGVY